MLWKLLCVCAKQCGSIEMVKERQKKEDENEKHQKPNWHRQENISDSPENLFKY